MSITFAENSNSKLITRYYTKGFWSGNPDSSHVEYNDETNHWRFFDPKRALWTVYGKEREMTVSGIHIFNEEDAIQTAVERGLYQPYEAVLDGEV